MSRANLPLNPMDVRVSNHQELFRAACNRMLDGRVPQDDNDGYLLANYFALNLIGDQEKVFDLTKAMIHYYLLGITDEQIRAIVEFQFAERQRMGLVDLHE